MIHVTIPNIPPSVNSYWHTKRNTKTGRPTRYLSKRAKEWKELVNAVCKKNVLTGRLEMNIVYYLPDNRRRDVDNLSKAVLDALEGIYYADDKQIYKLSLEKKLNGKVRTEVTIDKL